MKRRVCDHCEKIIPKDERADDRPTEVGPTDVEMEAARWIGSAKSILSRARIKREDMGTFEELMSSSWPALTASEDWDEAIDRAAVSKCSGCAGITVHHTCGKDPDTNVKSVDTDCVPRRNRLDFLTSAELAIYEAMQKVEELPADERLTEAVILLGEAKHKVADYVDDEEFLFFCDTCGAGFEDEKEANAYTHKGK